MREPPLVLVVDDNPDNREILVARLTSHGYATAEAIDGAAALAAIRESLPDLVLLDVMMPGLDGLEVCRQVRGDPSLPFVPIVLVTAKTTLPDIVAGLEAGADDYVTKPVDHGALVARVRATLRTKALHDTVQAQSAELRAWNDMLERRVAEQVAEIERVNGLRRFLPPQIADLILSHGAEELLASHRRQITAVFCDLRGFTAFAEEAEPEKVMAVLQAYHAALGPLVHRFDGTLERFLGDGLVVIFNDPVPCPDPALRAVGMAVAMRDVVRDLSAEWARDGFRIGFGTGIAQGEAMLGRIGFEGRYDYAAIGRVANLGARLCAAAQDGEILVSETVAEQATPPARTEYRGDLALKGFARPVPVHAVLELSEPHPASAI